MEKRPSRKKTLCDRLWNSAFIDDTGNVYSCCRRKTAPLGNIHKQMLPDIINGPCARRYRQLSLDGKLRCYRGCSLVDTSFSQGENGETMTPYSGLKRLHIQFSEKCNLQCAMCYQDSSRQRELSFDLVRTMVPLAPFTIIMIQGGEPLCIKSAQDFFDYATAERKNPSFLTNGTLIDDVWTKKIADNSAFISISINAATQKTHEKINRGSHWPLLVSNIEKLRQASQNRSDHLRIIGRMTIVMHNLHEIALFIRTYKHLGFDAVDFGFDTRILPYLCMNFFHNIMLRKEIQKALKTVENKEKINLKPLISLGLI
jgi:MoaA/NifB/PqqE/SkfB family radical SAM enzyme